MTGSRARHRWVPGAWVVVGLLVGLLSAAPASTSVGAGSGVGVAAASPSSGPADQLELEGARYTPLTPARLLDTRIGLGVPDARRVKLGAGQTLDLQVTGRGGVPPTGVSGVVMNVTVTSPTAPSYLKVWPTGVEHPNASNLNFTTGQTIANLVTVKVGAGGKVSFYNPSGSVDVLADVVGFYGDPNGTAGSLHHGLTPARILDTRKGTGAPLAKLGPGQTIDLDVTGVGGVPGDSVAAVVMNVTVTNPTTASFLKVWPTGEARPNASTINFVGAQTIPNLVIAKVGAGGKVSFYNPSGSVDVLADVVGWYGVDGASEGASFTAVTPARIMDTRNGTGVSLGKISASSSKALDVTGVGGVPGEDVSAVVVNVTATEATQTTFVTVYPSGVTRPLASNLNVSPGITIPNLVVAKVGADGQIRFFNNSGAVHVIADVVGWFGPEEHFSDPRLLSSGQYGSTTRDTVAAAGTDGAIHVAWREVGELLYRKIDRNGNTLVHTLRTGFQPVASTGLGSRYVQLAPQPDGGVAILWISTATNDATRPKGIWGARLGPAGQLEVAPRLLLGGTYAYLAVDSDSTGKVHAIAHQLRLDPSTAASGRTVYAAFGADLRPAAGAFPVTSRIAAQATRFTGSEVEADGTVHLAWFDDRRFAGTDRYDVFYSRFGGDAPPVAPLRISDSGTGYPIFGDSAGMDNEGPNVAVDGTGRAHVSWIVSNRLWCSSVTDAGAVTASGVEVDVGAYQTTSKYFDHDLAVVGEQVSIVFGAGSDISSKLIRVRVDGTGAVRVPAQLVELGAGSFGLPSVELVGGDEVIVGRRSSPDPDVVFVATTAGVGPTDRPDFVVDDAHGDNVSTPSPPKEGTAVTMTVQVANAGFVAAPATSAEFRHQGELLGTVPVPALAPEATAVLERTWTVPTPMAIDPAGITVTVDPANTVAELTEVNNTVVHEVPIWLRPSGTSVVVAGFDETSDPGRQGYDSLVGVTARLAGTPSEGGGSFDTTVVGAASSPFTFISGVPPGTYVLTVSKAGYSAVDPIPVTVTRNPSDPYQITTSTGSPVEIWFNRWGTISGVVTAQGGGALAGAIIEDRTGRVSVVSQGDGSYSLTKVVPGTHLLTVTRTGHARQVDVPVVVGDGQAVSKPFVLAPTTSAYVDVTVEGQFGTSLAGANVVAVDGSGNPTGPSCLTNSRGRCSMTVPGGVPFRVEASAEGHDDAIEGPFTVAAGDVVDVGFGLNLTVGALTRTSRSAYISSWVFDVFVPDLIDWDNNTYWWFFYGNYHTDLAVYRQDIGGVSHVQWLEVALDGDVFTLTHVSTDEDDDFGAEEGGVQEVDPSIGAVWDVDGELLRSNVRIDDARLVDVETGEVFWQLSTADPGGGAAVLAVGGLRSDRAVVRSGCRGR